MIAVPTLLRGRRERLESVEFEAEAGELMADAVAPPWSVPRQIARASLGVAAIVMLGLTAQLVVISGLQHQSAQGEAFAKLRDQLAEGTAPLSGVDEKGKPLPLGTPEALLEIPRIGLREVISEGTAPSVLADGPGRRRDTPMPGQRGVTEVYGRRAAYGGPFKRIGQLKEGDEIKVTTGQAVSTFHVVGSRRAGDRQPRLAADESRLSLATASGSAFVPSGVFWVDADLIGDPLPATRRPAAGSVPDAEKPMGNDATTVWALVLWLQALIAVAIAAVWSWMRWGRHQTWIVFGPVAAVVSLATAGQVTRLLPNLL